MVLLHDRVNLTSHQERVSWLASGLYHEAKHIQFYETLRPDIVPGTRPRAETLAPLGPDRPQIPCAWKGVPSGRSLPDVRRHAKLDR